MNLGAIRDALAAQLVDLDGINVYARFPDHDPALPCAIVLPDDEYVAYHTAFANGLGDVQLRVVLIARGNETGQTDLDAMLSSGTLEDRSVPDAINGDRTLGGAVSDLIVRRAQYLGRVPIAADSQTLTWQAEIPVACFVPHS
jgi:hypothetical protein